ncbi:MAG: glycosyltransferase 87 family protein [Thermoanaerobaculia bacterium]
MPLPDRPARSAAVLWLGVLLVAWAIAALSRVLPYLPTSGGDFANLHRGAAALVAGESAYVRPELDYPPLVPVVLAPLGLLSLEAARYVWLGLSLLAVLAAMVALWRLASGDLAATCAVAVVLALDGSAIPNLALGQMNPILLLLVALALLLHRARPAGAAAAVGCAAALKIWPGLLLLSWLPGERTARFRATRTGLLVGSLLVALPLGVLMIATPPPHLPIAHGYWLGTPALLNFSAPAAVLRASYGWKSASELPRDWVDGVNSSWRLAPPRQHLSVAISLAVLAAGLAALWLRLRSCRRRAATTGPERSQAVDLVSALVALALVAAPIAWYHYQLLQLPAFVLAVAVALRRRRWGIATALAATLLALTHHELVVAAVQLFAPHPATALYLTGILLPLLGAAWYVSRLAAIGDRQAG